MNKKWIHYCGFAVLLLSPFALAGDKANTAAASESSKNDDSGEYKTLQAIKPEKTKKTPVREEPRPRAGSSYTSGKIRLDRRGIPKSKHSTSLPDTQQQGTMP